MDRTRVSTAPTNVFWGDKICQKLQTVLKLEIMGRQKYNFETVVLKTVAMWLHARVFVDGSNSGVTTPTNVFLVDKNIWC